MLVELTLVQKLAVWAMPMLFALTVPEMLRAYAAHALGDNSGRAAGRLSPNPLSYVDPVGTLLVPAIMISLGGFVIGWPKPVPTDARGFRHPLRDLALTAAAIPGANLLMAIAWGLVLKLVPGARPDEEGAMFALWLTCDIGMTINLVFMFISLLPVPPLPGGTMLLALLPRDLAYKYAQVERYGIFIVIAFLIFGGKFLMPVLLLLKAMLYMALNLQF